MTLIFTLNLLFLFSGDPNSNLLINFDTKEEAIAFAIQRGRFPCRRGNR